MILSLHFTLLSLVYVLYMFQDKLYICNSASLWLLNQVSDKPIKSEFFWHRFSKYGTLLSIVCGQNPCTLKKAKLLIIGNVLGWIIEELVGVVLVAVWFALVTVVGRSSREFWVVSAEVVLFRFPLCRSFGSMCPVFLSSVDQLPLKND